MIAMGQFDKLRLKKHSILYLYNPKCRNFSYNLNGLVTFHD